MKKLILILLLIPLFAGAQYSPKVDSLRFRWGKIYTNSLHQMRFINAKGGYWFANATHHDTIYISTKLVSTSDSFLVRSGNIVKYRKVYTPVITPQELGATPTAWNVNNGINAYMTISGNTTITLSNLVAGTSGNLTITNSSTVYTLTFSGYTNKISPVIYSAANKVILSGGSKIDVFSWYYDGVYLIWNGGNDYK